MFDTHAFRSGRVPFDYLFCNQVRPAGGVYAFWLRDECLYVGMSGDLRRRIGQHSTCEDNPELAGYFRACPGEIQISLEYLACPVPEMRRIERDLIRGLHPVANRQGTAPT